MEIWSTPWPNGVGKKVPDTLKCAPQGSGDATNTPDPTGKFSARCLAEDEWSQRTRELMKARWGHPGVPVPVLVAVTSVPGAPAGMGDGAGGRLMGSQQPGAPRGT